MQKALVTGGAGFIGSHLCDRLLAQGVEVVVIDDFSLGQEENLTTAVAAGVKVVRDDVLNIGRHRAVLEGVDRIFHLAALISGHDSLLEPQQYWEANMFGLLRVIDVAKDLPGCRILFASSSTVYGDQGGDEPLHEDRMPDPITAYAATKLAGEHTLRMYGQLHGFGHTSLRLFNVYGPRQNPDHPYANVTCKFAQAGALGTGVKLYGDGEQSRDFVFVDDIISAFLAVADASKHHVYNVGTGEETSIAGLLDVVGQIRESPLDVERCAAWPNDIHSIRADVSRLRDEFGLTKTTRILEGLQRTVEFFRT